MSTDSSTPFDPSSKRERTPKKESGNANKRPVESNSFTFQASPTIDDDLLSAVLDESSFGDRLVPRSPTNSNKEKKQLFQPSPLFVPSQQIKTEVSKKPDATKDVQLFFTKNAAETQVSQPTSDVFDDFFSSPKKVPAKQSGHLSSTEKTTTTTRQAVRAEEESGRGSDVAESIQNQFVAFQSSGKNSDELPVEHKGIESPPPVSSSVSDSNNTPGLSYSYFVFGSSNAPEQLAGKLQDNPIPSLESELTGKSVGSPGSASASIDQLFNQFSPFSQQDNFKGLSDSFKQPETTAERPVPVKSSSQFDSFRSQFSSNIAPFVQTASPESAPPFIPTPPTVRDEAKQQLQSQSYPSPRAPEIEIPIRTLVPPALEPLRTEDLALPPPPKVPPPNSYAGFIPSGTSDTFSEYPKPNFAAFHPPPSTETVYYGGFPNEPPSHLRPSVVGFIKSNAVAGNDLKAPSTQSYEPPAPPNFSNFDNPAALKSISNAFAEFHKANNRPSTASPSPLRPPSAAAPSPPQRAPAPATAALAPLAQLPIPISLRAPAPVASSKPNSHPLRSSLPNPNLVNSQPTLNSISPATTTVGRPSNFLAPPAQSPVAITAPKLPSNPASPGQALWSTPITSTNPAASNPAPPSAFFVVQSTGFVPSQQISNGIQPHSMADVPLARPIRLTQQQQYSQQGQPFAGRNPVPAARPSNSAPFVPSQSIPSRPGVPAGGTFSLISTSIKPPAAPPKRQTPNNVFNPPQLKQVLPSLTKNPAPIPVLAPMPVYLTSGSVTLPKPSARYPSNSYAAPLAKPIHYNAVVSYG